MKIRIAGPTVAALALVLAACGGGGGDRPSASEISDKFQEAGATEEQADCAGEVLEGSDISDGALRELVEADVDESTGDLSEFDVSDDDEAAGEAVEEDLQACILGDVDIPEVPDVTEGG